MDNEEVMRAAIGDLARVVETLTAGLGFWIQRFVDDPVVRHEMRDGFVELHKIVLRVASEFPARSYGGDPREVE